MPLTFEDFFRALSASSLAAFETDFRALLQAHAGQTPHGNEAKWDQALSDLPTGPISHFDASSGAVEIGCPGELNMDAGRFRTLLKAFSPWRKGPWRYFGVDIDTEWRSDWKWNRLAPHISPLAGRTILDVGSGNGYYLLRMLAEGTRLAIGIDPTLLFLYQFNIARRLMPDSAAFVLPFKSEQMPAFNAFDTVFSLGVLYHRRNPLDHLAELMHFLRPGGELVLETLVIPGDATTVFNPPGRYAKMANVWSIPSTNALETWLWRLGFQHVRTVDVTRTTTEEQRATEWMTFQSLADFLHPDNPDLTIEGHPGPQRAILIATKD